MKITQIQINGIRGFSFNYDNDLDQEIPHNIELQDCNSFLLYGENGTGKSSFFDALEWALTGDIEEEAKVRRKEVKQFLKHSFSSEQENPNVKITFKNNQFYHRKLTGSNAIFEFENSAPYHFIESNRISTFVTDTKSSLWKRFLDLIGLEDLLEVQNQLKFAKTEFDKEFEPQKKQLSNLKSEKLSLETNLLKLEINLDEKFDKKWKEVTHTDELQFQIVRQTELKNLLDELNSIFPIIEETETFQKQKDSLFQQIANSKDKINLVDIAKILEHAENYFKENNSEKICPVCNEETINENVIDTITKRKKELNNILDNEEKLKNITQDLKITENNFSKKQTSIKQKLLKLGYLLEENTIHNLDFFVKIKEQYNSELETLKGNFEIQNNIDFKEHNQKIKEQIILNKKVEDFENELKLQTEAITDFENYFTAFKKSYEQTLIEELKNISSKYVTDIYNKLNETDNEVIDNFRVVHDIEKQEIKFVAIHKYTNEDIDPINILSTAHLRCLGFALLMSRIFKKNSALKFIAIDDPIYAIDHEHRYSLINYLVSISKNYQLLITTSDRNFYDIFRNKMRNQMLNVFETHLEKSNGTIILPDLKIIQKRTSFIEQAKEHLIKKDYRSTALYTRLAIENVLFDTAKKYSFELNLVIGKEQNISLDSIFKCVSKGLKNNYSDKISEIDKEFSKISNNIYFKSLLTNTPLNKELHQSILHKDFLNTKAELEELINVTDTFIDFLNKIDQ